MDIEGTYTLQASPEESWQSLLDYQVLRRAIPGLERLEPIDKQKFAITLHIKQAPLVGTYRGHITVTEQQPPFYYHIAIEGEGRQSTITGQGAIHLSGRGENTIVAYKGSLNLGKLGTLLPSLLVKGTAKLLIQQFFTSLADQLRVTKRPSMALVETVNVEVVQDNQPAPLRNRVRQPQGSLLQTIVRRLGLGDGDPVSEAEWTTRVRRFGIVVALLLLVWVGTRIPRR